MGYLSKDIADETTAPAQVSLSGLSNFLVLTGKKSERGNVETKIGLKVMKVRFGDSEGKKEEDKPFVPETQFTVTELNDESRKHTFQGTWQSDRVDDTTFLLCDDITVVAENIRACLLKNSFFRGRFEITIPFVQGAEGIENGDTIVISSLGAGKLYTFTFEQKEEGSSTQVSSLNPDFMQIVGDGRPEDGYNSDLIDEGMGNVNIEADIYTGTGIFLGENDMPAQGASFGRYVATMTKAYFGEPIWFDTNALMNVNKTYSDDFLRNKEGSSTAEGTIGKAWVDAGTINDLRLVVKKNNGISRETFYYSNVLYALTGYARTLDNIDPDNDYVYQYAPKSNKLIRPLSNQPVLPHVKGQTQYFNFIFKDPTHGMADHDNDYRLGIQYDLYTQSGKFIARVSPDKLSVPKGSCYMVNNIRLDIDEVVDRVEAEKGLKVGIVEAALCCGRQTVSRPLEYRIMPECLYRVNDFAFLNPLGGWSSFNFGGEGSVDTKSESNTVYSTLTPGYTISSRVESVFDKEIKETYSVKTLPVGAETAEWLREIAASVAVYELSTGRYVVVDDLDVKYNTTDRLFVLEMKYHYSDTYNGVVK